MSLAKRSRSSLRRPEGVNHHLLNPNTLSPPPSLSSFLGTDLCADYDREPQPGPACSPLGKVVVLVCSMIDEAVELAGVATRALRVRYVVKATALARSHRPKKPLFNGDWWVRARHHRLRYDATNFSKSVSPESRNLNRLIPFRLRV